jgi:hypothetical protein
MDVKDNFGLRFDPIGQTERDCLLSKSCQIEVMESVPRAVATGS